MEYEISDLKGLGTGELKAIADQEPDNNPHNLALIHHAGIELSERLRVKAMRAKADPNLINTDSGLSFSSAFIATEEPDVFIAAGTGKRWKREGTRMTCLDR